jgi:two-component system chemotaxis response regulator CheY
MVDTARINTQFQTALQNRESRENLLIMIVEDQQFSLSMLNSFLKKDYDVITASNGQEALVKYVTYAPDILFLDIEIPSVDGHRVRDIVTKMDPDSFIFMVTASNYKKDVQKAISGGAKGFVIKPYTKAKIYECIDKYHEDREHH